MYVCVCVVVLSKSGWQNNENIAATASRKSATCSNVNLLREGERKLSRERRDFQPNLFGVRELLEGCGSVAS